VFLDRPLHQRALTLMRMRRARHLGRPGVLSGVGHAFRIDSEVPIPITLDGELTSMTTPARVHLLPAALRVVGRGRAS
jgi:diacylglycerol kinase family enzyme